jgi:hypothetical protein
MKDADFPGKQNEMQQYVGMHDQEQCWPEPEEAKERQIHIEEWQLDRFLEEQVLVRDAAHSDQKVEQHEEIAEPQARTDASGIDHRSA